MIAGFNTVDGGEICFDDRVINNLEAHKRDIGMVSRTMLSSHI